MKKYAFKQFDNSEDYTFDPEILYSAFQEFAEQGYHYHSWVPGTNHVSNGDFYSIIFVFEKDVEDESNDF